MGAATYLTSADVLNFTLGVDPAGPGMVSEVLNDAPLLARLAARPRQGFSFRYSRKTADPFVGFRAINDGRTNSKATYDQKTVTCEVLDASNQVDVAVADADELGIDHCLAQNNIDHLQAALFAAERQIIYGGDALGFDGFVDLDGCDGTASDMVVDATGSTANTASSVWLIRTSNNDASIIWGSNGQIKVGERTVIQAQGATTGTYPAWYTPITAWMGLQVAASYDVCRIANLTAQTNKGLTDDLIAEAISRFPSARQPNIIALNRRSLMQLQQSRQATSPTGAPPPFPTEAFNIPIVVTDSIINTESILGVTG